MGTKSSVQVFCPDYQRLLKESQISLTTWNNGRADIHNAGRRGRDADNTLRILQGNFARAWAALQRHDQYCEVCQRVSMVEGRAFPGRSFEQPYAASMHNEI
jgi:hypothetical protein